jgi:hypothetical protein
MKALTAICVGCAILAPAYAHAQGTFIYDQQSATNEGQPNYGDGAGIQGLLPSTGQSLTAGLTGIDFIRLIFDDANPDDGAGATIYLNLRSDSITGPTLGSTAPVSMINGFRGTRNFFFQSTISLTPQTTYYFDLVFVSGGPWNTIIEPHTYPGGEASFRGSHTPGGDYWFREGIVCHPRTLYNRTWVSRSDSCCRSWPFDAGSSQVRMRLRYPICIACFLVAQLCALAQGAFTYDQQSSTNEGWFAYGYGRTIQNLLPHTGQSFVPTSICGLAQLPAR